MKKIYLSILVIACLGTITAQNTKHVLFLGNSYTGVNNLPQMVADVALSLGDTLIFESNTPGGFTFNGHSTNAVSQSKIAQGGWDYVILQEQSQLPAFPYSQFSTASLPYSITLAQQIRAADSCTKPLFYMTWGRKNGDQQNCQFYPPMCTYAGMQGQLRERYLIMGDTNHAEVTPVGAVWREFRASNPTINLYQSDESHPSLEGSYLAACTFYASIFHKSPVGAAMPATINPLAGQAIQNQVNQTVFDSLNVWMIDTLTPKVNFVWTNPNLNLDIQFDASISQNVDSIYWNFGDGTFASGDSVLHTFPFQGVFIVVAKGWKDCQSDSISQMIWWQGVDENTLTGITIYPNPTSNKLRVQQFGQEAANAHFKIYDISGKLLLNGEDSTEINVASLAQGVYLLGIEIDNKVSRQRFVKY